MHFSQTRIFSPIKTCKALIPQSYKATVKCLLYKHHLRNLKATAMQNEPVLDGVNLVGPIKGNFGLGQSCRLVAEALRYSKVPFIIHDFGPGEYVNKTDDHSSSQDEFHYRINLLHVNPSDMWDAYCGLTPDVFQGRYNIGFWLWEQPEFPHFWSYCFDIVDEIWTPSEFVSEAIRKRTTLPVYTMPYCIEAESDPTYNRTFWGLPEESLLFLTSYDSFSIAERKNPLGAVRAFKAAFQPGTPGVGLVIKATHAPKEELDKLRRLLAGYDNIYFLTDSYSKIQFNSLVACCDVFVSLHRAEGFGLVMAEAMLLETAVIATNWSANTEFMNPDVAFLVDAAITELRSTSFPYLKGTHWSEPDESQASNYMRQIYQNPSSAKVKATQARAYIMQKLSKKSAAERIEKRLYEIQKMFHSTRGNAGGESS